MTPLGLSIIIERGSRGYRGIVRNERGDVEKVTRWFRSHKAARQEAQECLLDVAHCINYDLTPRAVINGVYLPCQLLRAGEVCEVPNDRH
ncbi:hypothetical protein IAD21_00611 [Abditibacteriota bacterium]|nr:hypothetical protein IAD21_00611 [Abditibacteriota bacterium]